MVTLRDWWTARWRSLAEWQRALLLTLCGGFVWTYALPLLGSLSHALSTTAKLLVVGNLAVGTLFVSTRRRLSLARSSLEAHLHANTILQYEALIRLDILLSDMSDSIPDGGQPIRGLPSIGAESSASGDDRSPSTVVLFAFALGGNAVGVLAGIAVGLGEFGSMPVFTLGLLGGAIVVGLVQRLWPFGPDDESGGPDWYDSQSPAPTASVPLGTGGFDGDLERLGRTIRTASNEFEVEIDDGVLRVQQRDRS